MSQCKTDCQAKGKICNVTGRCVNPDGRIAKRLAGIFKARETTIGPWPVVVGKWHMIRVAPTDDKLYAKLGKIGNHYVFYDINNDPNFIEVSNGRVLLKGPPGHTGEYSATRKQMFALAKAPCTPRNFEYNSAGDLDIPRCTEISKIKVVKDQHQAGYETTQKMSIQRRRAYNKEHRKMQKKEGKHVKRAIKGHQPTDPKTWRIGALYHMVDPDNIFNDFHGFFEHLYTYGGVVSGKHIFYDLNEYPWVAAMDDNKHWILQGVPEKPVKAYMKSKNSSLPVSQRFPPKAELVKMAFEKCRPKDFRRSDSTFAEGGPRCFVLPYGYPKMVSK